MALKITADADDLDHLLTTGALQPHLAVVSPAEAGLRVGAPAANAGTPETVPSFARMAATEQPTAAPDFGAPSVDSSVLNGVAPPSPIPALQKPTNAESRAAGRAEFRAGMPQVSAEPFTPGFYKQKQEQVDYKRQHPWGSPISEVPGFAGKVGHALAEAGNIAGDILAPEATSMIPGSQLNLRDQEAENQQGETAAIENETRQAANSREADTARAEIERDKAEADNARSEIQTRKNPPAKEGLTPDERTFNDLMRGNNGQPRINPDTGKPYTSVEADQAVKQLSQAGKRFTDPFEAFTYGTPAEKKSAQDFITFDKQTAAHNDKPSEIAERYALYQRDPQAYMDMFGSHDSAQGSRDQAQATRLLNYFDKRRNEVRNDYTLDDAEKTSQLAEIDALEKPYLEAAQSQQNTPRTPQQIGGLGGNRNAPQYKVGDTVTYKGQQMRVSRVRKDGKLELQPIAGGGE